MKKNLPKEELVVGGFNKDMEVGDAFGFVITAVKIVREH